MSVRLWLAESETKKKKAAQQQKNEKKERTAVTSEGRLFGGGLVRSRFRESCVCDYLGTLVLYRTRGGRYV